MLKETLTELFERDLHKLITEIELYKDENELWLIREGISNSAGNLCLHIIGNLNHFVGATLGNTSYVRNRDEEFSLKNIPRNELVSEIENSIRVVTTTLETLPDSDIQKDFPLEMFGRIVTNTQILVHLYGHLSYHLGQINYHRRLVG